MTTFIDLGNLGSRGFGIISPSGGPLSFARVISGGGDMNGDGFADLLIGDYGSRKGGIGSGAVYVVYGGAGNPGTVNVDTMTAEQGFTILGQPRHQYLGWPLANVGDINDDGLADLVTHGEGKRNRGEAVVIFGRDDGIAQLKTADLTPADGFSIKGHGGEYLATRVSAAGDMNGDGVADMILGAAGNNQGGKHAGAAYVIYGRTGEFGTIDLLHLSPADGFMITGDAAGDYAGGVSSAGDINGDGFDDLMVQASGSDLGGKDTGTDYVIFGKAGGLGPINLAHFRPSMGFTILGTHQGAFSSAGDVNGDGYADLLVEGGDGWSDGGAASLIWGKAGGFGTISLDALSPEDGYTFKGAKTGDQLGYSLSAAGDVNADGFDDIILGAPSNDRSGYNAGVAYVIYGKAGGFDGRINLNFLSDDDGFVIQAPHSNDPGQIGAGAQVVGAGDVNGDGFADVMVGGIDKHGPWVVYGAAPTGDVTRIGSDIGQTIRGGEGSDRLEGLGGDDVLISAGGNDTVLGGTGNDDINGGDGDDTLSGDADDDIIHGGAGTDQLSGGDGNDVLYGGPGKDTATGGAGADSFHFSLGGTAADAANADVVTDFHQAEHDVIDLTDYDADPSTKPDDPFTFIGAASFSGVAGELRSIFAGTDTLVSGDTNGDGAADFTIRLTGNITLTAADFLFAAGAPVGGSHLFLAQADLAANPYLHLA